MIKKITVIKIKKKNKRAALKGIEEMLKNKGNSYKDAEKWTHYQIYIYIYKKARASLEFSPLPVPSGTIAMGGDWHSPS